MPAKSKNQFKLMKGICTGTYPSGYKGISRKVACEFVKGQSSKGLPEKKGKGKSKGKSKRVCGSRKLRWSEASQLSPGGS